MEEQQRHVDLVAKLNELGSLLRRLREKRPVVAQDPDRVAMNARPPADQGGPVQRLELLEVGPVDDARDDFAHVEGRAQVLGHHPQQIFRIVNGLGEVGFGFRAELAPVEVLDHFPAHADAIQLVQGEVIAESGYLGMHVRAAEALLIRVLAGGHLHQGRPAEKNPGLVLDEDVVVAHSRLVGAPGSRRAEDHRYGGNAHLGKLGDLVEQPSRLGEVVHLPADRSLWVLPRLPAQVCPGGLHELHVGHTVDPGDL